MKTIEIVKKSLPYLIAGIGGVAVGFAVDSSGQFSDVKNRIQNSSAETSKAAAIQMSAIAAGVAASVSAGILSKNWRVGGAFLCGVGFALYLEKKGGL